MGETTRTLDRLVLIAALGLACGCASTERVDTVRRAPRRVDSDRPVSQSESSAWAQPRDERRFSEWPDVREASSSAVDAHLEAADRRFDAEDFHGAVDAYTLALGIDPESSYAYCNRGSSRRRLADYEGAIEDLTRAIELRPDYALAYNNRGYAYMRSGEPESAIMDYDEAIRLGDKAFPSYSLAMTYRNRARAYRMLGDYDQADRDEAKSQELSERVESR